MVATVFSLFNGAQRLLKDRQFTANEFATNSRESVRILRGIWDGGARDECLQAGQWKFATRTVMVDADPGLTPDFGSQFGFLKPDDWVRTTGVWSDPGLRNPYKQYREEAGFWYGSLETMYVSYVSNDSQFGGDFSLWPPNFTYFVEAHLASKAVGPLTERGIEMQAVRKKLLEDAQATDAMADPSKYPPQGSWTRARAGGWSGRGGVEG